MTESFDRRSFLRVGTIGLVGAMGTGLRAQTSAGVTLAPYVADVDGDGRLGAADIQLMRGALFTSRGFATEPNRGYDYRADVFGRAGIGRDAVDAVSRTIGLLGDGVPVSDPRPITVAWHYGWYDRVRRPLLQQTVRYLVGDYLSNDPRVEEEFNRLKNEFGITVDALSWMPPRVRPSLLPNYEAGYFGASNAATRHVALLYEGSLALPATGGRIDFRQQEVANLLLADFDAMARTQSSISLPLSTAAYAGPALAGGPAQRLPKVDVKCSIYGCYSMTDGLETPRKLSRFADFDPL